MENIGKWRFTIAIADFYSYNLFFCFLFSARNDGIGGLGCWGVWLKRFERGTVGVLAGKFGSRCIDRHGCI